jgi:hypothetical protein
MKRRTFVLTISIVAAAALGAGAIATQADTEARNRWTIETLPPELIFDDEPMMAIARELPGFGGFWFDDEDRIVVGLTNPQDLDRAIELVKPWLSAHKPKGYVAQIVRYPFIELAVYRTILMDYVHEIEGVRSLGVNESDNRVKIGVLTDAALPPLIELLNELQIPLEAVIFPRVGKAVRASKLRDNFPSVIRGGYQTTVYGEQAYCTLGFAARRVSNNAPVFLTASHCTWDDFATDNPADSARFRYGQSSTDSIGRELLDPNLSYANGKSFRNADAALISALKSLDFGYIARTTWGNGTEGGSGSDTIDAELPRFQITSRGNHTYENETLHKVGVTTGWTYGAVESTCDDGDYGGHSILCEDRVDLEADPGDSGSPVFALGVGDQAELRGILFATDVDGPYWDSYMSDLHQIELDLGSIVVHPITAEIETGPDFVPQLAWCQWVGVAREGIAPFSYEWRKDGSIVSTTEAYTTSNTGTFDFELSFKVTDAVSSTSTTYKSVTVDTTSTAFTC